MGLAGVAIGASFFLRGEADSAAQPTREAKVTPVTAAVVEQGSITERGRYPGELDADAADISAFYTGRLVAVHVRVGDRVEKDAVLAELDPVDAKEQIAQARAQARAAEAEEKRLRVERDQAIAEAAPDLADNPLPERALQAKVERLKGPGPDAMGGARPILRELECVVGLLVDYRDAEVEPLDIFLDENMVSKVDVNIPSSAVGEELLGSARAMPSTMLWTGKFGNAAGEGKQRYSLTAVWPKSAPGGN